MKYLTLLFLIIAQSSIGQTYTERKLNSTIDQVTIYLSGGLVHRTAKMTLPKGKSTLKLSSLSPYIDGKSVQVKAIGDFTIVSVNHRLNYLNRQKKDKKIDSLIVEVTALDFAIATANARLEVLNEKQSLLDENKKLGNPDTGTTVDQLQQAIQFYDQALSELKTEEITTKRKLETLRTTKTNLKHALTAIQGEKDLPTGEIEIRVDATNKIQAAFEVSYLVSNTGWYPKYDIRVHSVDQHMDLRYKADVYQNTGVNWKNVKLKLSNGNPNQSGVAPKLDPWLLNYKRYTTRALQDYGVVNGSVSGKIVAEDGKGLPGVNVIVKGTTVGTITDANGNYTLTLPNNAENLVVSFVGYEAKELPITSSVINAQLSADQMQLEEVVVSGYRNSAIRIRGLSGKVAGVNNNSYKKKEANSIATTTIENQTTVEFEIKEPYSIQSNGEKLSVELAKFDIEALYEYYAVPKIDKDAFLLAKIVNWDQYNLIEGEANLYFEDAYVGRTILNARSMEDTLSLSLGRDKSIVIGREKVEEYTKRKTIGKNKIESRGFTIIARNKKSAAIQLTLFDQIPVAINSEISISSFEVSNGKLDHNSGLVKWELMLPAQSQKNVNLRYEVKYPKYEKVLLE